VNLCIGAQKAISLRAGKIRFSHELCISLVALRLLRQVEEAAEATPQL
jgi:hypothetical protein